MTDLTEAARATRTRDELLEKVSAAIDETLYAYSHGMMSEAMAKESILTIADEWATDDDEILAHMEMLVRDYGAADDNSLTAGAKVLKRRVLVACAPLMNLIPPQPKLEWRGTGLSGDFEELCLGGLVVGFIFMRGDGNGFLGQVGARVEMGVAFRTREKARAAVESAVRKELGLRVRSPGRTPQSMRSGK